MIWASSALLSISLGRLQIVLCLLLFVLTGLISFRKRIGSLPLTVLCCISSLGMARLTSAGVRMSSSSHSAPSLLSIGGGGNYKFLILYSCCMNWVIWEALLRFLHIRSESILLADHSLLSEVISSSSWSFTTSITSVSEFTHFRINFMVCFCDFFRFTTLSNEICF